MNKQTFHTEHMQHIYLVDDGVTKYCPPHGVENTDLHPRVALKFHNGVAVCPYCGVEYRYKPENNDT